MRPRSIWLALGWAMVAGVVWLSLTPAPPQIELEQGDKLGHFLGYGLLTFWFSQLYRKRTRILFAIGFVAMGIGLELAQGELGYRSYEVFDLYANALGVLLGWALALMLPRALPGAGTETRSAGR